MIDNILLEDFINSNPDITQYYGFVYRIDNLETNQSYIGKKVFFNHQNKKLGKKEIANLPVKRGRTPTKKSVTTESNWKTYYGSSDETKEWSKNTPPDKLVRTILKLCYNSRELTYWETKLLFHYEVLENKEKWVNKNILGKFFS